MSQSDEMKSRDTRGTQTQGDPEACLRPSVDIYEDAQGIVLKADLPGVSRERLDIHVEGDTLAFEGQAVIDMPAGMEALYADVRCTRYRRSFTLSKELDTDRISAEMSDGVLTLRLPKRAEVQPRKIEINAG